MNASLLISCAAGLAFGSAALAADAPSAPKPGPEHEKLGYFVGKWKAEADMKESPMGPAGKMTSDDTCEWFAGKFAVICHGKAAMPSGGTMKSMGILGYSAEEKAYTYYGVDSSGWAQMTVPRGVRDGDTWTYSDESRMGGKIVKSRYVVKEVSPTSYTFKWEMQGEDGKWSAMMEGTETKVDGSAKKKAKTADKPKADEKKAADKPAEKSS